MSYKTIESKLSARVFGNDATAGFENGWVEMMDLNQAIAPVGTQEAMDRAIDQFKKGNGDFVFKGSYTGVSQSDPSKTIDLNNGYTENERSSYPLFDYVLDDVITVVE